MPYLYGANKWDRIGIEKRAGLLAPLFSLHSKRSAGVGDLEDLKRAVDWCERTGHTILQLLPMSDYYNTPYSTTTLFAVEPMYMAMDHLLGVAKEAVEPYIQGIREQFPIDKGFMDLNVKHAKINALHDLFQQVQPVESPAFHDYMAANKYWLDDYALFCALKMNYSPNFWEAWEPRYRDRDPEAIEQFCEEHALSILFIKWMQWQLYEQFKAAKAYANSKNVLLMGDLFYVSARDSSDVWARGKYFRLDLVPGLPPEPSHVKGQRWGDQPIYNWQAIIADDCELYKKRLQYNQNFFDIMRLDAASTLFKMWCIPREEPSENLGLNGFYYPGTPQEQEEQGRTMLTAMLDSTTMMLCAENLAPFGEEFTPIVRELGIPPINFQRWDKDWDGTKGFTLPEEHDPLTVFILSNHDTSIWGDWWENEAGTIDASIFMEYCGKAGLDYEEMKVIIFEETLSSDNKLRWRNHVNSHDKLAELLGRPKMDLYDLYHSYVLSYGEKEMLWAIMGLEGAAREKCDHEIIRAAIHSVQSSNAVWSITSILDYLSMLGAIEGDYREFRYNRPGTCGDWNWTITSPLAMEELLEESVCSQVRAVVESSMSISTSSV
nr:4-alpha-glucanotransferase [Paenibacillus oenotherae]